jgi:CDP-paratose 2-epimerase
MRFLITGGAGFIGSHVAEYYALRGHNILVLDNLSRLKLLKKRKKELTANWEYLQKYKNIELIRGDIRDKEKVAELSRNVNVIVHTAAQTAVTVSVTNPREDFEVNSIGTFNILEGARKSPERPIIIFCSTNKVYGGNVNKIKVVEEKTRYSFPPNFQFGIPESFGIDNCEHTPYGCSKLTGDIYMQDYARLYGLKIGIFRMSCIYGTRQFGVEDQGWVAWFTIATLLGKPITIYGDGKQVRDILYISDLIDAYDRFIKSDLKWGVFNIGGGKFTLSLIELINLIEEETGKRSEIKYEDWRPGDQKVYISDIRKVHQQLGWTPKVKPQEGVSLLIQWIEQNKRLWDTRYLS